MARYKPEQFNALCDNCTYVYRWEAPPDKVEDARCCECGGSLILIERRTAPGYRLYPYGKPKNLPFRPDAGARGLNG